MRAKKILYQPWQILEYQNDQISPVPWQNSLMHESMYPKSTCSVDLLKFYIFSKEPSCAYVWLLIGHKFPRKLLLGWCSTIYNVLGTTTSPTSRSEVGSKKTVVGTTCCSRQTSLLHLDNDLLYVHRKLVWSKYLVVALWGKNLLKVRKRTAMFGPFQHIP